MVFYLPFSSLIEMNGSSPSSATRDKITLGILIGEYGAIVALVWALSLEYQSNAYMRSWIDQNAAPVGYILNGYFAALLLGILVGSLTMFGLRLLTGKRGSAKEIF